MAYAAVNMTTEPARRIEVEVPADAAGDRVDRVVARLAGISRQRAMELLAAGKVRAGHRKPRKGDRVEPGVILTIELPGSDAPVPQPELPLTILHEDPWLLAIDKPAGISMHPLEPGETGTLANAVIARYPDVSGASPEARCPGLIHRLDRETSGVVLWARRPEAFEAIRAQFSDKTVAKHYLALVEGFVEGHGELNVALAHDPGDAGRMVATPYPAEAEKLKARPALTRYKALAHGEGLTLVAVEIPTGVMHQIRAHFGFVGYPVVGDTLYGGRPIEDGKRHLLHASSIGFRHPEAGAPTRINSPLPADFRQALEHAGISVPAEGYGS